MDNKKPIIGYIFGGLSFIPLIGVPFGITAIVLGVVKKTKIPIVLGILGILVTIGIYGSLYYFGFVAKSGPFVDLKVKLVDRILSDDAGQIAIYERKNGRLPDTLDDLGEPSPDNVYFPVDPWGTGIKYTLSSDGTFELRSAGPDKFFGTEDDIAKTF